MTALAAIAVFPIVTLLLVGVAKAERILSTRTSERPSEPAAPARDDPQD
jgi:hypothetical protein